MPTYRDPRTGRLLTRASPFGQGSRLGGASGSWHMRSHGHRPHHSGASGGRGHSAAVERATPATQSGAQAPHMELADFLPALAAEGVASGQRTVTGPKRRVPQGQTRRLDHGARVLHAGRR